MSPAWYQVLTVPVETPSWLASSARVSMPGVAESLLAAAQAVVVADVADDERVERAAFAAGQAAGVEDAGDLGVGVVIEELVDGGDCLGGGFAHLGCGRRDRHGQGVVLSAGQADVRGDGVPGPGDGDVGEQQPGDALALAGRGGGVVPDRGQVGDQLLDPGFLGVGELPGVVLAGVVVCVLGLAEGAQRGVPVGFESEPAQVTDAGRLTCAGAAAQPELDPLRRASAGGSSYGRNESRSWSAVRRGFQALAGFAGDGAEPGVLE